MMSNCKTHAHMHMHKHTRTSTHTHMHASIENIKAVKITEIAVPSDSEKDTNAKPHLRTHMHKASAEINELEVPR